MSINYYFRDKIIEDLKNKIIDADSPLLNGTALDEIGIVHIGQSQLGWVGLLQRQPNLYSSVSEMKAFFENNADRLVIVDDDDQLITWEQLEKLLLSQDGEPRGTRDKDGFYWLEGNFI